MRRASKLTDRRTNEIALVSFIAYSASGTIQAGEFCLGLRAEQDPEREGRRSVNAAGGTRAMTRAIGLRKGVSPFTGLQNIVLRRFIGFVSGGSLGGPARTMLGRREKEKARDVEARPV